MNKGFVFIALLMTLMTPLASAAANMQVTSSALPATGGSITPNGLKFFSGAASYSITVKAGWSIGSILIDGVASPISVSKTIPFDTTRVHTIKVTFSQSAYSITTSAGSGGQIQITGGAATNITAGSSRAVIIAPSTGYRIRSYLVDGGTPLVPADPTVAATIPFNNITSNHTLSATFELIPVVTAFAGADQTIGTDPNGVGSAMLAGLATSNLGAVTCQWNVTDKPAGATATFTNGASATTTFTVDRLGTFKVALTATSGGVTVTSAPAAITVASAAQAASSSCISCHAGQAQVTAWLASIHATTPAGASCPTCHMPNNEAHPGQAIAGMANICLNCHLDSSEKIAEHPIEIGTNPCTFCHNPHTTQAVVPGMQGVHYNNITGGMYPASYVTSKAACTTCHANTATNAAIRGQWAQSGHAACTGLPWIDYDFKTRNDCVQCHTTTGFIAYSTGKVTSAWGVASDKTKEVLTCIGCHSDIAAGTVRKATPVKPFADDSYINPNVSESNICMNCHSGRNNGHSLAKLAVLDNVTGMFIAPHYLAAGGTLHARSGYHFPGESYSPYTTSAHRWIGIENSSGTGYGGPCVACHKNSAYGHTFKSGAINLCVSCHGNSGFDTVLAADKTSYTSSLDVLKAQLAAKGFEYSTSYPYFGTPTTHLNWGDGQAGANNMGAAFNYVLLLSEPGAFAHNSGYAKKLIFDSIDYLHNGSVTGSITSALDSLVAGKAISPNVAENVATYKATSGCMACHSGLSGAHAAHVGSLSDNVSAYGDEANYSIKSDYRFGCGNCHPLDSALHRNGIVNIELYNPAAGGFKKNNPFNASRTGTGNATVCINVYCHSSGQDAGVRTYAATPAWGGTFTGNRCAGCHGDPPAYASGGAGSVGANSHYSQSWDYGQLVEGGHLVGLHFDNIRKDPADQWQTLFPRGGGPGSGAGHGDPATSTTISCPSCHAATVSAAGQQSAQGTAFACSTCHWNPLAGSIADKSRHVNGTRDVEFMTGTFRSRAQLRLISFTSVVKPLGWTRNNGFKTYDSYDSVPFSGSYNSADKSCMTTCHLSQPVKWGDTNFTCFGCHADL